MADVTTGILRRYARSKTANMKFLDNDAGEANGAIAGGAGVTRVPLYAHVPFCKSLCPFCSFNRHLFREGVAREYYALMSRELEMYAGLGYSFSSINIGGGTPTVLVDELALFIDRARSLFGKCSVTVESTPQEITDDSIAVLRSAGVSRLSIGVQSFDCGMLSSMGRSGYTGNTALERIALAKGKFDTVGIDMMFNFPSQTFESVATDLEAVKSCGADQVTYYPLMPGPNKRTAVEKKFSERIAGGAVGSKSERAFYSIITKSLIGAGYVPNSVWTFSRQRGEIGEYLADSSEYIGVGASSISVMEGMTYLTSSHH